MFKNSVAFFILFLLSLFTISQIFQTGFFPIHDDTQVQRVSQMTQSLTDGMFPVRWVKDLGYGYGYPIFNFYAPLAYYIGSSINLIGFDALIATKIMMGLPILLSGLSMYMLASRFWGRIGGLLAGVMYMYSSYLGVNIFVRGAVGEAYAMALTPFVFYGLYEVYIKRKFRYVVVAGLSYAFVILSHNLTAMMITPFVTIVLLLFIFFALKKDDKRQFYFLVLSFVFAFLLSAFYFIPVFPEMKFTNVISQVGGNADYKDHFLCISQLWDSPFGYGGSAKGCIDGMSFKVGKLHVIFSIFVLPVLFFKISRERRSALILAYIFLFVTVFFTLHFSRFIWEAVPPMVFFQFPWRFLVMISLCSAFVSGAFVVLLQAVLKRFNLAKIFFYATSFLIVCTIIIINLDSFMPQTIYATTAEELTSQERVRFTTSKISDEYLPRAFLKPWDESEVVKEKVVIASGSAKITHQVDKTAYQSAKITVEDSAVVQLNTAYFPAWQLFVNGVRVNFAVHTTGMLFILPKGEYQVELKFIETPIERVSNLVSLIGVVLLIAGIIITYKKKLL